MYDLEHIGRIRYGKGMPGLAGALMPDIMDFQLKEIAEIKPLSSYGLSSGPIQLLAYLKAANFLGLPGATSKPWTGSAWNVGIRQISLPPQYSNYFAVTLGNAYGLIFYKAFKVPKTPVAVALTAVMISLLADSLKDVTQQIKQLAGQGADALVGAMDYLNQQADTAFAMVMSRRMAYNVGMVVMTGMLAWTTAITIRTAMLGF